MGLRDRLRKVVSKLSGEYSAGESEVRTPSPEEASRPAPGGEVKVTRARLKRARDLADEKAGGE